MLNPIASHLILRLFMHFDCNAIWTLLIRQDTYRKMKESFVVYSSRIKYTFSDLRIDIKS